jgi:hypothetical protein
MLTQILRTETPPNIDLLDQTEMQSGNEEWMKLYKVNSLYIMWHVGNLLIILYKLKHSVVSL